MAEDVAEVTWFQRNVNRCNGICHFCVLHHVLRVQIDGNLHRTQSVTPRELLQNTIASDPEPKEKQKPIKC